jgi:hypothetical protein
VRLLVRQTRVKLSARGAGARSAPSPASSTTNRRESKMNRRRIDANRRRAAEIRGGEVAASLSRRWSLSIRWRRSPTKLEAEDPAAGDLALRGGELPSSGRVRACAGVGATPSSHSAAR